MATPAPTNLYDYYQSQGKTLPTTAAARFADPAFAAAAGAAGFSASNYSVSDNNGSANNTILQNLIKSGSTSATPITGNTQTPSGATVNATTGALVNPAATIAGSSPATTGATPYVSSSASVLTQENNTTNALKTLTGQSPDFKALMDTYKNSTDTIASYQTQLEARRVAEIDRINKQYEQNKADTTTAQNKEKGTTNVALTRLGGYLGGSGSGSGVIENLAVTHRAELAKLDTARDAAIQAANNAVSDKQFALAQEKVNEANQLQSNIYSRQQDFFNNALKLSNEQRANQDQIGQTAKDLLSAWENVGDPSAISSENKSYIDSVYGTGFSDQYLKAQAMKQAAAGAKSEQDAQKAKLDTMKSYVDLLESVPAGTKIPFGGETITGIGKTADVSTFQVTDDSGNVRIVNYNKGSGSYSITNLGGIGKDSNSSGGSSASSTLAQFATKFAPDQYTANGDAVLDQNGYVNPSAWKDALQAAAARKIPRSDFIKQYGHFLYNENGDISSEYGLTPQEKSLVLGN